jgi:hypothetical protein
MDFNLYATEWLVRERMREAERVSRLGWVPERAGCPRRRPLRVAVGLAMVRLGRWMSGDAAAEAASSGR